MIEVIIGGVKYTLTDKPLRKDVLRVRKMQKAKIFEMLDISAMREMSDKEKGNVGIDVILQEQILSDPGKLAAFTEMEDESKILGTIMLAAGIDADAIGNMQFDDSEELYAACVEVLGGDISAFFPDSNMSTSSPSPEAVSMSEKINRDCDTSPQANQPQSLSETSNDGREAVQVTTSA